MGGDRSSAGTPASSPRLCAWARCGRVAAIQVLAGDLLRRRRRHHGYFCTHHAVEVSRSLRARAAVDVWFNVVHHQRRYCV